MKTIIWFMTPVLAAVPLAAQTEEVPLLRPEEKAVVDAQAVGFNQALEPVIATAAKSTVRVWAGKTRLAYGTVVGDGRTVLTKFSEVARAGGRLVVDTGAGSARPAKLSGLYQDEDIAVLTIEGEPFTPVVWHREPLRLGAFLTAPQPGGKPAAFGVVSVLERSLRETDKAYLGVMSDFAFPGPGVKVTEVKEGSGAAAAGLREGDVILRLNDRKISGLLELRATMKDIEPNEEVRIEVDRNGETIVLKAVLGNRPNLPQFSNARLRTMERMGTNLNRVRDDFPNAIQTDMRPNPNQVGGPVVDLEGRVVGITLARADRTRSFVMPAAAVARMLEGKPLDPAVAKLEPEPQLDRRMLRMRPGQGGAVPPGILPAEPDRMRRHVEDMQRLMDRMRAEMERMEQMNR
jgi:serine protease Do